MFSIAELVDENKEVDNELRWKEKGFVQIYSHWKCANYGEPCTFTTIIRSIVFHDVAL